MLATKKTRKIKSCQAVSRAQAHTKQMEEGRLTCEGDDDAGERPTTLAGRTRAEDGRTPSRVMWLCRSKVVEAVRSIVEMCWCVGPVVEDKLRWRGGEAGGKKETTTGRQPASWNATRQAPWPVCGCAGGYQK